MGTQSPFEFIGETDHEDAGTYRADFQLPDDGTPNSAQHLRVKVVIPYDLQTKSAEIALSVLSLDKSKERKLGYFETREHTGLACLLYGVARKVTVEKFEPC